MDSCGEGLQPFLPYVPSDLVSRRALERILSVAQQLPAALGAGPFGLECPLDGAPVADFSVAVLASRGDPADLSRLGRADSVRPPGDGPGWERIRRFASAWADAASPLHRAVEEVWLEFDVGSARQAAALTPSVFFDPGHPGPRDPAPPRRPEELVRIAGAALGILQEGRPSPGTLSALAEFVRVLPATARVRFLGAMIPRATTAVRVVVAGMSLGDVLTCLRRPGSRGTTDGLARIAPIADLADRMWLAVDVDETGVAERLGLDCYCGSGAPPAGDGGWPRLLQALVEAGVCTSAKRDALLGATELSSRVLEAAVWPESLRRVSRLLGPGAFDRLELDVHHVKVVLGPGARLQAKGYLRAGYR
ncbi:hypothetical protein ACI8AK_21085 [Geodermatophilus sp. SYSU D00867]